MKPYYEDEAVTIYHADCRELLPELKADLVLTDPPYGIGLEEHGRSGYDWSIIGDDSQEVGQAVLTACESQGIPVIVFASPMRPWAGQWRQYLVWDKGGAVGGGGDPSTCWKSTWELIQIARTGKLAGSRDAAVLKFGVGPVKYHHHPAQKPVTLLRYLIGKIDAGTILDPFMGTGSTLRAAKDLGRKAIGIEIEERYCEVAATRMAQLAMAL